MQPYYWVIVGLAKDPATVADQWVTLIGPAGPWGQALLPAAIYQAIVQRVGTWGQTQGYTNLVTLTPTPDGEWTLHDPSLNWHSRAVQDPDPAAPLPVGR